MPPTFSDVGHRLAGYSGIQELMDDLGDALHSNPDIRMLGGGQPSPIPAVQQIWHDRMQAITNDPAALNRALLYYDHPAGNPQFREIFTAFLRREYGWDVKAENVIVLPSSQYSFFLLFNLLAGETSGTKKRMLFPLMPEYIGYSNVGLTQGMLSGLPALIEHRGPHEFKYHIDFDRLRITPDIAGLCISCPTNPTGNVLSREEFVRLRDLSRQHNIPLIVDNAYGYPFPGVIHTEFKPAWEPGMIFSISLSKLGLPGTRTSIIVADAPIAKALSNMNACTALACSNLGQTLLEPLLLDDSLIRLSKETIVPFYQQRSDFAYNLLQQLLGDKIEWAIHSREGAFFLWLWLPKLSINCAELYQRLKARNVLILPGHHFFYGLDEPWPHSQQCIRITFSQRESVLQEALEIIADELIKLSK